ncbi:MAG: thioredoxin family protein [Bacteroidota bacterium]
MNKTFVCIALLLGSISLTAQDSGIHFKHEAWAEVLAQAAKESKMIFVDAYTTWCGPCKKMSKEIFPQKAVGDFFNKNFINVKLDMEKGEGPTVAQQYDVMVYPTLLFLAADGTLVHRSAGYHNVDQFLELGNIALDPNRRLSAMDSRYASGDRSPEFLYAYTLSRFEAQDGSHAAIAEEYMATQNDWATDDNLQFLFSFIADTDSKMFDYLLDNRQVFAENFGTRAVTAKIQDLIYSKVYDSADNSSVDQVAALFKRAYPDKADQLTMRFRMAYYRQAGDREGYAQSAVAYFDKYDGEADELNETAWTFFRVIKDKKLLKKAVKWSKEAIKQENSYYNNDTLAALYHKLGKKRKARKTAERAIEMAKAEGVDYSETEKLLAEING